FFISLSLLFIFLFSFFIFVIFVIDCYGITFQKKETEKTSYGVWSLGKSGNRRSGQASEAIQEQGSRTARLGSASKSQGGAVDPATEDGGC
ncbi:MAG: hypothetical protein WCK17_03950, partial [Verrucomicrobiota bacterium]